MADTDEGCRKEQSLTATPMPAYTPTNDIRRGFVYERVQHVTLKSIANNPDIIAGMTRADIDAAINRHAEFEQLYDRPHEDQNGSRHRAVHRRKPVASSIARIRGPGT